MTRDRRRLSNSHGSSYIETHSTEHLFVDVETTSDLSGVGTRSLATRLRYLWPSVPVASEHVANGQCGFDVASVVVGEPGLGLRYSRSTRRRSAPRVSPRRAPAGGSTRRMRAKASRARAPAYGVQESSSRIRTSAVGSSGTPGSTRSSWTRRGHRLARYELSGGTGAGMPAIRDSPRWWHCGSTAQRFGRSGA